MNANTPPPVPVQGERVLSYLRELWAYIKKNTAVPGAGITTTQMPDGRVFNVLGRPDFDRPFRLFAADSLKVGIEKGYVYRLQFPLSSLHGGVPPGRPEIVESTTGITVEDDDTTGIFLKLKYAAIERQLDLLGLFLTSKYEGNVPTMRRMFMMPDGFEIVADTINPTQWSGSGTVTPDTITDTYTIEDTEVNDPITYYLHIPIGVAVAEDGVITSVTNLLRSDYTDIHSLLTFWREQT